MWGRSTKQRKAQSRRNAEYKKMELAEQRRKLEATLRAAAIRDGTRRAKERIKYATKKRSVSTRTGKTIVVEQRAGALEARVNKKQMKNGVAKP